MQAINERIGMYSTELNTSQSTDLIDYSVTINILKRSLHLQNLPKEKALRDQAEKRALQARNDEVTKKLIVSIRYF